MKKIAYLFVAGMMLTPALAAAQDKAPAKEKAPAAKAEPTKAEKGKGVMEAARVTATVESVDQKTREVTLKSSEGKMVSFVAGPDVRNLEQVKKGDVVTIEYAVALAMRLAKTAEKKPSRTVNEGVQRAAKGEMPGGVITREIRVIASVEEVDAKASKITLKGPEQTVTLKVEDPKMLEGVKKGDMVEAVYAEAVAIKVERAPAKK